MQKKNLLLILFVILVIAIIVFLYLYLYSQMNLNKEDAYVPKTDEEIRQELLSIERIYPVPPKTDTEILKELEAFKTPASESEAKPVNNEEVKGSLKNMERLPPQ